MRKINETKLVLLIALLFLTTIMISCKPVQKKEEKKGLVRTKNKLVEDIPIPSRSKYIEKSSFVNFQSNRRSCDLKYVGEFSPADAIAFFKREMVVCNWNLKIIHGTDLKTMYYIKRDEICLIEILEENGKTIFYIKIFPKP